jgi:heat shock protein HtpX
MTRAINYAKTALLLGLLTTLLVFAGYSFGGSTGMGIGLLLALVMNVGSYWFSDKIVLAMHHAVPADPQEHAWLFQTVSKLATRAGLPVPRLYIVNEAAPNAFATGRNPEHAVVAVTTGLLELLRPDEIEGVLAHELGHVRNRDILIMTVAATLAGVIQYVGHMAMWFGFAGRHDDDNGGGGGLIWALLLPFIAMLTQLWISRTREYAADAEGATLAGSPRGLADALRRMQVANQRIPMTPRPATAHMYIVAPFAGGGVLRIFATHPAIEERIRRLEQLAITRNAQSEGAAHAYR